MRPLSIGKLFTKQAMACTWNGPYSTEFFTRNNLRPEPLATAPYQHSKNGVVSGSELPQVCVLLRFDTACCGGMPAERDLPVPALDV